MAQLLVSGTASPGILVESMGSCKLLAIPLITNSASDTFVLDKNDPVVAFWAQSNSGFSAQEPDITWTPSTGTFLLSSGTVLPTSWTLFVMQRS